MRTGTFSRNVNTDIYSVLQQAGSTWRNKIKEWCTDCGQCLVKRRRAYLAELLRVSNGSYQQGDERYDQGHLSRYQLGGFSGRIRRVTHTGRLRELLYRTNSLLNWIKTNGVARCTCCLACSEEKPCRRATMWKVLVVYDLCSTRKFPLYL
jgi:hypothetical protein